MRDAAGMGTLVLSGRYDHSRLDDLLDDTASWLRDPSPATLDLDGLEFATPVVLAVVAASFDRLPSPGSTSVRWPSDEHVRRYVRRMDLVPEAVAGPDPARRNTGGAFCGIQRFAGDDDYPGAAQALTDAIATAAQADTLTRGALRLCLDEVLENVVHHAASPTGGVAICQTWPKRRRAEAVVLDLGRGIRESLRSSAAATSPDSDAEALRAALTLGVTATPERNAGMGLAFSAELVTGNGGDLELRSGTSTVAASATSQDRTSPVDLPGTLVRVTIRTDRALDAQRAYLRLDDLPA